MYTTMKYRGLDFNHESEGAETQNKVQVELPPRDSQHLPPMSKDFKNYLKHKSKEMNVKSLIIRLRIEEDNKVVERRSKGNSTINGAHIVENDQNNSKKRKKVEQERNQSKRKFKEKCFNCGKIVHKSTNCRAPKKGKKKYQANMIECNKECDDLCAMFFRMQLGGESL
ncbi:hypothetical protein CQW23_21768 [Capsicum baccatum]|uniref:CCHC-type domain-containing protein n=1 Tax=Capsicum baccatum TaxID=33114 RepID=A0A2G2VYZ2_CAPBA|nr:hypothetical protein CQW23_21768 [Capsicum baccatum]